MLDRSPLQRAAQLDALRKYARHKEIPEDVVVAVYERERHQLTQDAKIERFVDILAEKRVKRALGRMKR